MVILTCVHRVDHTLQGDDEVESNFAYNGTDTAKPRNASLAFSVPEMCLFQLVWFVNFQYATLEWAG